MANWTLAVVLTAFGGGTAWASNLSTKAASLNPGEWVQLGTYPDLVTATADEGGFHTFEYSWRMYWVRNGAPGTGKFRHVGSGHAFGEWHLVEYDEATDSWSQNPAADLNCHIHSNDQFTVDVSTGDLYALCLNNSFQKWTGSAWVPLTNWPGGYATLMGIAHFPETGLIWAANGFSGNNDLRTYNLSTNTWTDRGSVVIGENLDMVYSPVHRRVIFSGGDANSNIYVIAPDGGVSTSAVTTPERWRIKKVLADYDPVTGDILLFFSGDDSIRRYNPITDQLTSLGTFSNKPPFTMKNVDPTEVWGGGVILGTIPDYGVIAIADDYTGAVWLYRPPGGSTDGGVTDAGVAVDAGTDAGTSTDAGTDAGVSPDAGTDAGGFSDAGLLADAGLPPDAGVVPDAGGDPGTVAGGCGCQPAGSATDLLPFAASFLALIAARRRRKS